MMVSFVLDNEAENGAVVGRPASERVCCSGKHGAIPQLSQGEFFQNSESHMNLRAGPSNFSSRPQ